MADPEKGALRLAILKENFQYRDLFAKCRSGLEKRYRYFEKCEELILGNALTEYNEFTARPWWYEVPEDEDPLEFLVGRFNLPFKFVFKDPFEIRKNGRRVLSADECIVLLDPEGNIYSIPSDKREYVLPRMYYRRSVEVLPLDDRFDLRWERIFYTLRHQSKDVESLFSNIAGYRDVFRNIKEDENYHPGRDIDPNRRVLLVDISKKRGQLIKEFKDFLDGEDTDTSRERGETAKHLEVWRMVRYRGMKFRDIATELGITVNDAELSYRRAHELTQGCPWSPGELRYLRKVEKSRLPITCETCGKRETCEEECESIKGYVNHGERRSTREITVGQPDTILNDGRFRKKKMKVERAVEKNDDANQERKLKPECEKKAVVLRKAVRKDADTTPKE